jgi:hypothetical protein
MHAFAFTVEFNEHSVLSIWARGNEDTMRVVVEVAIDNMVAT